MVFFVFFVIEKFLFFMLYLAIKQVLTSLEGLKSQPLLVSTHIAIQIKLVEFRVFFIIINYFNKK